MEPHGVPLAGAINAVAYSLWALAFGVVLLRNR